MMNTQLIGTRDDTYRAIVTVVTWQYNLYIHSYLIVVG